MLIETLVTCFLKDVLKLQKKKKLKAVLEKMCPFPLLILATFGLSVYAADPTIVQTEYGPIKGLIIGDGTRVFRSIPYAKPPIGDLRYFNILCCKI